MGPLFFEVLHRLAHVLGGGGIELLEADITHLDAISTGVDLVVDGMELNALPSKGQLQGLSLALEGEGHRGARLTTDQLDGILSTHALGRLAVDRHNHILGLNASSRSGRTFNR